MTPCPFFPSTRVTTGSASITSTTTVWSCLPGCLFFNLWLYCAVPWFPAWAGSLLCYATQCQIWACQSGWHTELSPASVSSSTAPTSLSIHSASPTTCSSTPHIHFSAAPSHSATGCYSSIAIRCYLSIWHFTISTIYFSRSTLLCCFMLCSTFIANAHFITLIRLFPPPSNCFVVPGLGC